jgi:hypothetical protein
MTPRISLITAVVAAALAVGVPAAFGDDWGSERHAGATELTTVLDARERSLIEKGTAAVEPRNGSVDRFIANDNRFQVTPGDDQVTVSTAGSGTDIEWPQIGFGAGLGMLIALGLMLVVRTTRSRALAH